MHFPLRLVLQPSVLAQASILAAYGAAGLALFLVPELSLPGSWQLLACGALGLFLGHALWRDLRRERAKHEVLVLRADGSLAMGAPAPDGTLSDRSLYRGAVDLGWALWLPLQDETGRRRVLMLWRGNVQPSGWRLLRIWLRHKVKPAVAGG